jgi:hypothetical protein
MAMLGRISHDVGYPSFGFVALAAAADRLALVVDAKHELIGFVKVEVKKILQQ